MSSLYATVRQADSLMKHCTVPAILSSAARATCTGLRHWVRTGAVLEQVKTGAILAMYSGQNYNKSQYDNALQSRNQVGSSFKTYVLATAVKQGMNVQTSLLDGDSPLWIPPDSSPTTLAKRGNQSPGPGYYQVVNDESGTNSFGPAKVQEATAVSLNTAYTDLWHQVAFDSATGQHPVTDMAKAFGVDVQASGMVGGPNPMQDEAGIALGQASLTVEEQATTIATLADNGVYHSPHVIKKITVGTSVTPAKITTRTGAHPRPGGGRGLGAVGRHHRRRHRGGPRPEQRPDGHRQDRDHQPVPVGVLHGGDPEVRDGRRHVRQQAALPGAVWVAVLGPTQSLAFAPPPGVQTLFGVGGLSGYGGQ